MVMRKCYKETSAFRQMNKRGQIVISVMIAIAIVAVVLIIFLLPQISLGTSEVNPSAFLVQCIKPQVETAVQSLSKQGGYSNPDNFF